MSPQVSPEEPSTCYRRAGHCPGSTAGEGSLYRWRKVRLSAREQAGGVLGVVAMEMCGKRLGSG